MPTNEQPPSPTPERPHDGPGECCTPCGPVPLERNRYFTGKFMTARDFQLEQDYFLGRERLRNRLLHGWGIVCGLEVTEHPNSNCRNEWVVVQPGIAIDCCGRELVLCEPLPVRVDMAGSRSVILALEYVECAVEHVPVLYGEGRCNRGQLEPSRIREGVRPILVPSDQVEKRCWPGDPCECAPVGCLEPDCPCGHRVPLAEIKLDGDHLCIDVSGRRETRQDAACTRICGLNWDHGACEQQPKILDRDGVHRLKIDFSRPLARPSVTYATGINRYTLRVEAFLDGRRVDLPCSEPRLENGQTRAVVDIYDPTRCGRGEFDVFVTLWCDQVLDEAGRPVDGEFLRGELPTGDGRPGGVFRSHFHLRI